MSSRFWTIWIARTVAAIAAPLLFLACSGGSAGGTVTPPPPPSAVAAVTVTPSTATVFAGGTTQLTATPRDAAGAALSGRTVTWSSGNSSVASVSAQGLVTGVSAGGPVTITATSEGIGGSATITVSNVPVASVAVTPAPASVIVGATTQLTATLKDAGNNTLAGRTVAWLSSNPTLATVSATGLVSGIAIGGPVTITATSEGINGTSSVTVTPVPVATVSVAPGSAPLNTGATVQLTATTKDAAGNALAGRTISWASSSSTIATVSAAGLVTAVGAGNATITATSEGHSGAATVAVTDGATIGLAGGTVDAANGAVKLVFQANTVPNGTAVTVAVPATSPAPLTGQALTVVPGATYSFGPDGALFAKTVSLTIHYDVAKLPPGALESDLAIYTFANNAWTPMAASTVDLVNRTVTASITHFSTWGVLAATAAAAGYTVTDLGTLPGALYSAATGLNINGDVVGGSSNDAVVLSTPFLYRNGAMTALPLLPGPGPNYADAINASGQIAGVLNGGVVRWTGAAITALGGSGGFAINASGEVAGGAPPQGPGLGTQPAILTPAAPTYFTLLPGYTSGLVTAINDSGGAAGILNGTGPQIAVRFNTGHAIDLGAGPFTFVTGMNNAGQIVGYSNNNSRAYQYSNGAVTFLPVPAGTLSSIARSINTAGQIVGEVSIGSWGRAVLFGNGGIVDLNTLVAPSQFVMISAYGINDHGQIVGYGVTSKTDLIAGHAVTYHAFLLSPK